MSKRLGKLAGHTSEIGTSVEKQPSIHARGLVARVSIGLPVYNGEPFLQQALISLLRQTYKNFELIISDNASTDNTEQICRTYAARDPRIRYYRNNRNRGASWNFNRVFELAGGEYFKWAAHDDLCAPGFLRVCVSAMDHDPGIVLCYSWTRMVDAEGRLRRNYRSPINLLSSPRSYVRFRGAVSQDPYCCYELFGLTRRAVLGQTPLIGRYTGSDRMLLANIALMGRFHEVPAYLFFSRDHPNRSIKAYPRRFLHVWFDPKLEGRITFPHWRWLWEYRRSIVRSRLSRRERLRCYPALFSWARKNRKELVTNFREAGMLLLRRLSPRTGELVSRIVHEGPRALFGTTNGFQR